MAILNTSALVHTVTVDGQDLSQWLIQGSLRDELLSASAGTVILACTGTLNFQGTGQVDLDDYTNPVLRRGAPVAIAIDGQPHPRGSLFVLDARYDANTRALELSVGCALAYRSGETFPDKEDDGAVNCSIVEDQPDEYDLAYFLTQAKLQSNIDATLKTIKQQAAPGSRVFDAVNQILLASNAYCWTDKTGVVQVRNYNLGEPQVGGVAYELRKNLVSFNRVNGGAPPAPKYRAKGSLTVLSTPEEVAEELSQEDSYLASRITDRNGNVTQSQAGPRETVTYEYEAANGVKVKGNYTYNKLRVYNKFVGCLVSSERETIQESRGRFGDGFYNALGAAGQPQDNSRNDFVISSDSITNYFYNDDNTLSGKEIVTRACQFAVIGSLPWESRDLEPIEITNAIGAFSNIVITAKSVERYKRIAEGLTLKENFEYAIRGLTQSDAEAFQKGNATVSDVANRACGILRLQNYSSEIIEGSGPAAEQAKPFFFERKIDYDVTVEIPPRGTPIPGLANLPERKLSAPELLESQEEVENWLRRYGELDICEYKAANITTGWRDEFYDWEPLLPYSVTNLDGVQLQFLSAGGAWAFDATSTLVSFDGLYVGQVAGAVPEPFQPDFAVYVPPTPSGEVFTPGDGTGGNPGTILFPSTPPAVGTPIVISSTGTLPGGLTNGQTVFVQSVSGNTVTVSTDPAGTNPVLITSTGTGTVTVTQSPVNPNTDAIVVTGPIPQAGTPVQVTTTGTLPGGLSAGTTYYVQPVGNGQVQLSTDPAGQNVVNITSYGTGAIGFVSPPVVIPPFEVINRRTLRAGSRLRTAWITPLLRTLLAGSRLASILPGQVPFTSDLKAGSRIETRSDRRRSTQVSLLAGSRLESTLPGRIVVELRAGSRLESSVSGVGFSERRLLAGSRLASAIVIRVELRAGSRLETSVSGVGTTSRSLQAGTRLESQFTSAGGDNDDLFVLVNVLKVLPSVLLSN